MTYIETDKQKAFKFDFELIEKLAREIQRFTREERLNTQRQTSVDPNHDNRTNRNYRKTE